MRCVCRATTSFPPGRERGSSVCNKFQLPDASFSPTYNSPPAACPVTCSPLKNIVPLLVPPAIGDTLSAAARDKSAPHPPDTCFPRPRAVLGACSFTIL